MTYWTARNNFLPFQFNRVLAKSYQILRKVLKLSVFPVQRGAVQRVYLDLGPSHRAQTMVLNFRRRNWWDFAGNNLSVISDNCSLSLTLAGHHVGGQGKWGNCGPGCPIPPGIQSSELCGDNGSCSNSTRHLNIPLIFPVTTSIYMIIWFPQMIGFHLPLCLLPKKVGAERKSSQRNGLISSSDFWQLGKTWLMTCSLTSAK